MTQSIKHQNNVKQQYDDTFNEALNGLNKQQRKAVDQTEGAVLVVAGPGTGKTQLLAARIGNILRKTDATPSNILCLTFTDAGAFAMRNRLIQFIGPEAYNVSIYTFHSFCNKVITENIEFFGGYFDLQAVSALEREEINSQINDELPNDHPLKKLKGKFNYESRRLSNLFDLMKKEGWSPEFVCQKIDEKLEELKNDPEMYYKKNGRGYKKGDFKQNNFDEQQRKFDELRAGALLIVRYNELLQEKERFDFSDMILWVTEKFKSEPELLLQYQERYQYFLVDEYQDTNGAQNELLNLLTNYWENPNLFVVGDDDQAIFRFQGANMDNIVDFKKKYNPELIILDQNYRSAQEILDYATDLIKNNDVRLANLYPEEIQKNLNESRKSGLAVEGPRVQIMKYPNTSHEELALAEEIIHLYQSGENLSEVAVIYRKHKDVENIVKYLEYKKIPLNIKKRIDVLKNNEIKRIIHILTYLEQEGKNIDQSYDLLFEILHYEYFDFSPREIGLIFQYCAKLEQEDRKPHWHSVLSSVDTLQEIGVENAETIVQTYKMFQDWISESKNLTLQVLFEKILTEGNIIQTIMKSAEKVWRLQIINSFFDFIKEESTKNPLLSLPQFLKMIDMMVEGNIDLPYEKIISNENGVNFITAHSSKGLEFKYVYIVRCESKNWGKTNHQGQFSLPDTLVSTVKEEKEEDERRLFFVAMTRAKDLLKISYPEFDSKGKNLEPLKFLVEIMNVDAFQKESVDEDSLVNFKADLMKFQKGEVILIDHALINRALENFSMSVTNLNKYLACPLKFYFEAILKVPMARNANMGFGRAMHKAMELLFRRIQEKSIPSIDQVHEFFIKGMDESRAHFTVKEFEDLITYGKKCLDAYYHEYKSTWSFDYTYQLEHKIKDVAFKDVPITGVLDKMAILNNYVIVTDYKTGNADNTGPKLKGPIKEGDLGGDYWRQIVFYKILLSSDPMFNKEMNAGVMDFLEPDKMNQLKQTTIVVEDKDIEFVGSQLTETYTKIMNHEFAKGCEKEDCKWCNFVKNNFELQLNEEDIE